MEETLYHATVSPVSAALMVASTVLRPAVEPEMSMMTWAEEEATNAMEAAVAMRDALIFIFFVLFLVWNGSGKFSFFSVNFKIIDLFDTDLYKKDLLGLKYLDEEDRLHIYETNCSHTDHRNPVCFSQLYPIFIEYL